jgi:hypothetical protein
VEVWAVAYPGGDPPDNQGPRLGQEHISTQSSAASPGLCLEMLRRSQVSGQPWMFHCPCAGSTLPKHPPSKRRLSLAIAGVGQLSIRDRLLSEHNYHALAGGMCSKPAVASSPLRLNRRVERAQRPARVHALGPGDGDGNMHCKCMSVRGCAVWTRPRGPRGRVGARIAGIANR